MTEFGSETLPFQKRSAPTRWSVQLINAFEAISTHDADPRTESSFLGEEQQELDDLDGSDKQKVIVYLENIRDEKEKPDEFLLLPDLTEVPLVLAAAQLNRRTTAHELLHAMNTPHDEAIMCYFYLLQANEPLGGTLTDCQVAHLRDVEYPVRALPMACPFPPPPCQ